MTLGLYYHTQRHIMANSITNASVEELTETYNSDVSYLGVPTFASNNKYDNYCDANCGMNLCQYLVAVMCNWFNVGLLSLTKMKYACFSVAIFIIYLNVKNYFDIDVNENYVFISLYMIDVRRQLNAEIAEALIAVVYLACASVNRAAVDPVAYSVLYVIIMSGRGPTFYQELAM